MKVILELVESNTPPQYRLPRLNKTEGTLVSPPKIGEQLMVQADRVGGGIVTSEIVGIEKTALTAVTIIKTMNSIYTLTEVV